jgi:hypothetical protein
MKISVVSVESSGGEYDCPVQVAWKSFPTEEAYGSNVPSADGSFRIIPDDRILPSRAALHGMDMRILSDLGATPIKSCGELFNTMWEGLHDSLIIGYGVDSHTLPVLQNTTTRLGIRGGDVATLDLSTLARKIIPQKEVGDYRMDSVYMYFFPGCYNDLCEYRCPHDANHTLSLLRLLQREIMAKGEVKSFSEAFWKTRVPVKIPSFPFGKYRGRPIAEVVADQRYCQWLSQQEFFLRENPDAAYSLCVHGKDESVVGAKIAEGIMSMCSGSVKLPSGMKSYSEVYGRVNCGPAPVSIASSRDGVGFADDDALPF